MRKLPTLASCLFLLLLAYPAHAQAKQQGGAPGVSSATVDTSKEAIVYQQVRGNLRYEADGGGSNRTYARIRVQTYSGVRKVGQLIFSYDSATSDLQIRTVRVTKPSGKVVLATPDAIQDMTSPVAQTAPMYTDLRQKHVVVPDLSPGDLLEYETVTTIRPVLPGKVWQVWDFVSDDICLDEEVELDAASSLKIKATTSGADPPQTQENGDRTVWIWHTHHEVHANLVAVQPPSSALPDARRLLSGPARTSGRRIRITTFASWSEIADWYAGLEHDRRIPDAEIRAKAQEVTHDAYTDLERTRAIYNYVARNIRYVSLSFGVGRYQPHAASEVLAHQYGDCKDKATLLEAMLDSVGIKAAPALLMATGYMEDVPSPMEFDHVINYLLVDGKELWLDSTLGVAPFGYLLPNVRGKQTLIATSELGAKLRNIPSELATPTIYRFDLDARFDDDRKLDARLSFETRGDWEVLLRLGLLQSSLEQMQSAMTAEAKRITKAEDFAIVELDAGDPYDTASPLHMSARLTATVPEDQEKSKRDSDKSGEKASALSPKEIDQIVSLFLPAALADQAVSLRDPKEWEVHLKFSFGPRSTEKATARLAARKATPVHLLRDFAEYDQSWAWNPPVWTANWRLASKAARFSGDRLEEYNALRAAVKAGIAEITGAGSSTPSEGPSPELLVRYSDALEALHSARPAEAQQILETIIAESPDFADAWRSLAQLRTQRKNWEGARQAYQKLIELPGSDLQGYNGLVRAYMAERLYAEAVNVAKQQIAAFGDRVDGPWNLGWAHLEAEQFADAASAFESAAKLMPRNARILLQLGRAYGGAHQLQQARTAFVRAVELDPSPLTLNDAAYYSAEAGLDLRAAEEESKRAVAAAERQANAVALDQINPQTVQILAQLASYWDTLGWIKFKKNDLTGAGKYLRAACDLSDEPTIQMHMGRLEEGLGHNDEAIGFYIRALDATQVTVSSFNANGSGVPESPRPLTADEREAETHLRALSGSSQAFHEHIKEGARDRNGTRTVSVPYRESAEHTENLAVLVHAGPSIASSGILPKVSEHSHFLALFGSQTPPQTFPDEVITSLPRLAVIHCRSNPGQCELEFLPNERTAEAFTSQVRP